MSTFWFLYSKRAHHQNSTKRKRRKKENCGGRGQKRREILGPKAFGGAPQFGAHPSGPPPQRGRDRRPPGNPRRHLPGEPRSEGEIESESDFFDKGEENQSQSNNKQHCEPITHAAPHRSPRAQTGSHHRTPTPTFEPSSGSSRTLASARTTRTQPFLRTSGRPPQLQARSTGPCHLRQEVQVRPFLAMSGLF